MKTSNFVGLLLLCIAFVVATCFIVLYTTGFSAATTNTNELVPVIQEIDPGHLYIIYISDGQFSTLKNNTEVFGRSLIEISQKYKIVSAVPLTTMTSGGSNPTVGLIVFVEPKQ